MSARARADETRDASDAVRGAPGESRRAPGESRRAPGESRRAPGTPDRRTPRRGALGAGGALLALASALLSDLALAAPADPAAETTAPAVGAAGPAGSAAGPVGSSAPANGPAEARSAPLDPESEHAAAASALRDGDFTSAIARLERLADSGFQHPDTAWNRARAYLARARSPQAEPGDRGRAVAALEEARLLVAAGSGSLGARDVSDALGAVRRELALSRAERGASAPTSDGSALRSLLFALREDTWLGLAVVGSALATLGLGLRALTGGSSPARLAGGLVATAGALLLMIAAPFALWAGHVRRAEVPAVVVAADASLQASAPGAAAVAPASPAGSVGSGGSRAPALAAVTVPEGELVWILERRGGAARVRWGERTGWVSAERLRPVGRTRP